MQMNEMFAARVHGLILTMSCCFEYSAVHMAQASLTGTESMFLHVDGNKFMNSVSVPDTGVLA